MSEDEEFPDAEMRIEAPYGILPRLTEWGIEEVDTGVCEDTYENRRTLRENKAYWTSVFDQYGRPTGHLQVITAEMRNDAIRFRKTIILVQPDDFNSDYITGLNLLLTPDADRVAPTWVMHRTREWLAVEDERELMGNGGGAHPSRLVHAPSRCVARKSDGTRCWYWHDGSVNRDSVCSLHTKRAKKKIDNIKPDLIQLARNRLTSAAHGAVDELEALMNSATSEPVRLGAAKEILDRVGIRGGIEIEQKTEITLSNSAELLAKRLDALAEKGKKREEMMALVQARDTDETSTDSSEEIIEAEIVGDPFEMAVPEDNSDR